MKSLSMMWDKRGMGCLQTSGQDVPQVLWCISPQTLVDYHKYLEAYSGLYRNPMQIL